MPKPVLTKRDFVRRYLASEFGNTAPEWGTLAEFLASGFVDLVHVRNRVRGAETWYDVPAAEVPEKVEWIVEAGLSSERDLYFAAMGPGDHLRTLQGEVSDGPWGLDLLWTAVRRPMRDALRERSSRATGLTAKLLLDSRINLKSREWLRHLLDTYPEHVVEFTAWEVEWGTVSGHDTTFWEVRKY